MKKISLIDFFIFIIFLLNINSVFSLEADVKIIKNSIFMDEYAVFSVLLKNPTDYEKTVQVYSADIAFTSETEPSIIRLEPNSEKNITLFLSPNSWSSYGAKGVSVMIVSSQNDKIEVNIPVYIKTFDMIQKKYSPSVELKVDFETEIDPRKEYPLTINLRNRNKLDIKDMTIMIRSKNFNYEINNVKLDPFPNGEYKQTILYSINPYTKPQEDIIEVILFYENKSFNRLKQSYKIIDYSEIIIKEEKSEEFFKKTTFYYIVNEGNIENNYSFKYPTNILKKIFVSSNIKYNKVYLKKDSYLLWNLNLKPMEKIELEVVENYRILIYSILIGLFSLLIYYVYRSPVVIKKEAIITGKNNEGISTMKVLLHLRNRSQDLVEKIEIKELIPSIAEFIEEEKHGTLIPSKIIRNDKKGTILKWELDALEPFEERLITFRLKSKIVVVGGLTLPATKIKFEVKGKERKIKSNKCEVTLSI